jgi:hypothetical protein
MRAGDSSIRRKTATHDVARSCSEPAKNRELRRRIDIRAAEHRRFLLCAANPAVRRSFVALLALLLE